MGRYKVMKTQEVKQETLVNGEWKTDIEKIIEELPILLVRQAYKKLSSGEDLTASEMKVCLDVCKTYSSEEIIKE
jgi:hypothetical protein